MPEYKVNDLIAMLKDYYAEDEVVIVSLWSKADVAQVIEDEGYGSDVKSEAEFLDDVWHHVSGDMDMCIEFSEENMNADIRRFVESYVMRGEK